MQTTSHRFDPVVIARYLLFVTTAVLVIFAIGTFIRLPQRSEWMLVYSVYAILMLGDAAAMLVSGLYLNKERKVVYWFAVVIVSLNIVLTIFDQFGLIDFLFSLLNFITLIFLLIARRNILA